MQSLMGVAAGFPLVYFPHLQEAVKSEAGSVYQRSIEMFNFGDKTSIIIKGSQKVLALLPTGFQVNYKMDPLRC